MEARTRNRLSEHIKSASLIGAGAVASSLGVALAKAGYQIDAVVSSWRHEAGRLAILLGAPVASDILADLPQSAIVFVCVPDDAIVSVAAEMAGLKMDWDGRLVAHTSGSRTASVMSGLGELGAMVASFHPLQAFPHDGPIKGFEGIYVGIEGADRAVEAASSVAELIGSIPVRVPTDQKMRYHLAAAVASNFLATLMALVNELLGADGRATEPGALGAHIFLPLVHETLSNIRDSSPEIALTGPIARGDAGTVRLHIESLQSSNKHLVPVYAALATETVRAAVRGGHISADVANAMLDVIAGTAFASEE